MIVIDIIRVIRQLKAKVIGKCECFGHVITLPELIDPVDDVCQHRELHPAVANNPMSCTEGHAEMPTLLIASWSKANGPKGALSHVVGVLLIVCT